MLVGTWCSIFGRAHRSLTVGFLLLQHFSCFVLSSPCRCCISVIGWFLCSRRCSTDELGSLHDDWTNYVSKKKVREKSRECHNHKPQPFPDPKRKRKPTNLNKHKPNKRTKSTKISSLFPKRGNRNTKRTEKHKNKMTHGKTYNKSPRRINHKATRSKTNTRTTALERSVEQTTGGFKALLQLANFTLGPDATLNRGRCKGEDCGHVKSI